MKKRINISIDYNIYQESKEYIHNLSRFLEKCLKNQIIKEKQTIEQINCLKEKGYTNEEINQFYKERDNLIEIANIKWTEQE